MALKGASNVRFVCVVDVAVVVLYLLVVVLLLLVVILLLVVAVRCFYSFL